MPAINAFLMTPLGDGVSFSDAGKKAELSGEELREDASWRLRYRSLGEGGGFRLLILLIKIRGVFFFYFVFLVMVI